MNQEPHERRIRDVIAWICILGQYIIITLNDLFYNFFLASMALFVLFGNLGTTYKEKENGRRHIDAKSAGEGCGLEGKP